MAVTGTGTQADPYVVTTYAELVEKAAESGKYVKIGNDINITDEYPNGDMVTRARLRNLIKPKLPFGLQNAMNTSIKLIDEFEVLSIDEWNKHDTYKQYPFCPVEK